VLIRTAGFILLISAAMLPPRLAGKVKTQTGDNIDLSRYKTYQWFPPRVLAKTGLTENHEANPVIMEVIERELSQRNLTEVAADADLQVQVWVLTTAVPQVEAYIFATGPGTLYGPTIATVGRYNREGTLVIHLIDAKTKKSAWVAMVTDSIPNGILSPDEIRGKLEKAAKDGFKKYPVKKK